MQNLCALGNYLDIGTPMNFMVCRSGGSFVPPVSCFQFPVSCLLSLSTLSSYLRTYCHLPTTYCLPCSTSSLRSRLFNFSPWEHQSSPPPDHGCSSTATYRGDRASLSYHLLVDQGLLNVLAQETGLLFCFVCYLLFVSLLEGRLRFNTDFDQN